MKILLLADANAAHSIKWIEEYTRIGLNFMVFSLETPNFELYSGQINPDLFVYSKLKDGGVGSEGSFSKLFYFSALSSLKRIVHEFKPDLLHAHYATSYGVLGALSNYHPFIISVWGSDVMSFPQKSFFHEKMLRYNLNKADCVTASSSYLKSITSRYFSRQIEVVPFGIDTKRFRPLGLDQENDVTVIGTVKGLEEYYGIETIIRAFNVLITNSTGKSLKLKIAGDGSRRAHLVSLVGELGLNDKVEFLGRFPYNKVEELYNSIDICVFASSRESFGVAVLEAQACGRGVVVSDIEGFREVYKDNVTALSFRVNDEKDLAARIGQLIEDKLLRDRIRTNAVGFVSENYNLKKNSESMVEIYKRLIKGKMN
ncbi:MAG: glycosyltransferase [Ignavibacteriaceae bacterium]|nr:glycosyltransferase [Ignavibacteriaceae bacterium]